MDSLSPRSGSYADTDDELRSLYDALDERDRYIITLEAEINRNATNTDDENKKCRDDLIASQDKVSELQVQLKQLREDNDKLSTEKKHLQLLFEQQENRQKREEHKKVYKLEMENQRFRAALVELEQAQDVLIDEIDTLVVEKSKYQGLIEDMTAKNDRIFAERDEMARLTSSLQKDNDELQVKLEISNDENTAAIKQLSKLAIELESEQSRDYRKELIDVKRDNKELRASYDQCLADKNAAESDLDSAIQALHQSRYNEKQSIATSVREEKARVVELQLALDVQKQKEGTLLQHCEDLEDKLNMANKKNALYEKGHGLEDAVRYQTKLEADIRRRDFDIKQLTHKNSFLSKACDILKEKANVGPEFVFDEQEINEALKCEEHSLRNENQELLRQLEHLEGERVDLLSQLRQQAIEIGEKGVKFLGMDSAEVAQVMEFASNLRRGIVQLPLNDRSADLLAQLSNMKAESSVDKITITKLEREIFALSETRKDKDPIGDGEKAILKHALKELQVDNKALKEDGRTTTLRVRVKEVIGQDLVTMSAEAESQFMCLMKEYDVVLEKLSKSRFDEDSKDATPNKELFRQLLQSTQENNHLKGTIRNYEFEKSTLSFGGENDDLESERMKTLSAYSSDISRLRSAVSSQVVTLNGIIHQKNQLIRELNQKIVLLKQTNQFLTRETSREVEGDVDRSRSSASLDRSIRRATEEGGSFHQSSLGDAAKLLREKDNVIRNLKSKLEAVEKVHRSLTQDASAMKSDIQTLVARLEEAEAVNCENEVYKNNCIELKAAVDDGKKNVAKIKETFRRLSMTANEKDAKIAELEESLLRAKRVLSVSRQGRSRSESNLKSSTDLISSLKEQIGKMETQITDLKQEKLKANTKVRRMSSKLGMLQSADSTNNKPDTEAMKDAEEKQKRIEVQNKTIAGLASQNSKLRSELAKLKNNAEKDKLKESCNECSNRDNRIAQLKQAVTNEKKVVLSSQSKLERCKKKAAALEKQIADLRAEQEKRDADANCASATDTIQQELANLREKNESLILAMKQVENDKTYDAVKMLRAENFQLRKENDRLLKVDHLKLFEEIETLKYKYNEAVGKLNSRTW